MPSLFFIAELPTDKEPEHFLHSFWQILILLVALTISESIGFSTSFSILTAKARLVKFARSMAGNDLHTY